MAFPLALVDYIIGERAFRWFVEAVAKLSFERAMHPAGSRQPETALALAVHR